MVTPRTARSSHVGGRLVGFLLTVILALALVWCGGSSTENAEPVPALELPAFDDAVPPARLALVVGIDRYHPDSPASLEALEGCVNDARRVQRLLRERFHFRDDEVLLLENEAATHAALVQAFDRWLLARSGPATQVLFWFSGHGSRVPDASRLEGAEPDGMDSTLVAYDSRAFGRDGEHDLCDDELRSLIDALGERAATVAVVTDCCHSGAVLRSAASAESRDPVGPGTVRAVRAGRRSFDPETVRAFWPSGVPLLEDGEGRADPSGYVHVAACAPDQEAHELRLDDGAGGEEVVGALTWFLARALADARPGESWRDVADRATLPLSTRFPSQTPWYEGALEREVLGGAFTPEPAGFRAERRPDGTLRVWAGAVHGLRRGARLAVRAGEAIGASEAPWLATVERLGSVVCTARFESPAPSTDAARGPLRVTEIGRPPACEPLRLYLRDPERSDLEWIEGAVEAGSAGRVEWVDDPRRADLLLEARGTSGRLELRAPEGLVLWRESAPEEGQPGDQAARRRRAASGLGSALFVELEHRTLLELASLPGDLKLAGRFESPGAEDLARWPSLAGHGDAGLSALSRDAGRGRPGSGGLRPAGPVQHAWGGRAEEHRCLILSVRNPFDEDLHLTVLSVAEDRSHRLVWPVEGRDQALVPAGSERRVPIYVVLSPDWPRARPMRDRYLLVATREYADFSSFRDEAGLLRSGAEAASVLMLAQGDGGVRLRSGGPEVVPIDSGALGVAVVDLMVEHP